MLSGTATEGTNRVDTSGFRADIEGLRAVGILAVVAFHIGLRQFSGGYVGVDVFFVISGFLICDRLMAAAESDGGIRLVHFWSRRIRRLAPALLVVIVATLAAGAYVYSPLAWPQLGRDATWSALYLSNVSFGSQAGGYFANADSALLHTWSLGVEEQFYVLWPLVLVAALWIRRALPTRLRVSRRNTTTVVLATGAVVSLGLCIVLTNRYSPWAYFSSLTRAWEFAAGGLLAAWARSRRDRRRPGFVTSPGLATAVGLAGLVLIAVAVVRFDELTRFPGVAALVPVAGTALLITAGPHGWVATVLMTPPVRYVGRISYSWYLWHWPAIVLVQAAAGRASVGLAAVAAAASFAIAAVSYGVMEQRSRDARLWQRARVAIPVGVAASVLVAGLGVAFTAAGRGRIADDAQLVALAAARNDRQADGGDTCRPTVLADGVEACIVGLPDATHRVLLVGDSHAAQWAPALEALTDRLDMALIVSTYGGCAATPIDIRRTGRRGASPVCADQRQQQRELIAAWHPDLVLLGQADYTTRMLDPLTGELLSRDEAVAATMTAATSFGRELDESDVAFAVLGDNPDLHGDPIECLARHDDPERCSRPAAEALGDLDHLRIPLSVALDEAGAKATFDPVPDICDTRYCWAERDGAIVYADGDHLSRAFVLRHTDALGAFVSSLLGP